MSTETCVIVGHGLSPLHKGWGQSIDQYTVIRMKDPSWQSKEDYGKRMDYCCASTETMLGMLDDRRTAKQYWAQPKKGQWNKHTEGIFRTRLQARGVPKVELVIAEELFKRWNALFLRLNQEREEVRNHSLGMFAITATAEFLKPQTILLVGFDNLMNPMKPDYWKANRGKWTSGHDWLAEHAMLSTIEKQYAVEIKPWA